MDAPCRSNSLAIHLSAILQSGWGNRCGIRSRCSQAWYKWEASEGVQDAGRTGSQASEVGGGAVGEAALRPICRSAACASEAPLVAKPTCACQSRTQGAYPLLWRLKDFWLVNPARRPR